MFNARNPFGTNKPSSDNKNLMANLNGPIIKKKMSFFIDFSRRQLREAALLNAQIIDPTTFQIVPQAYGIIGTEHDGPVQSPHHITN